MSAASTRIITGLLLVLLGGSFASPGRAAEPQPLDPGFEGQDERRRLVRALENAVDVMLETFRAVEDDLEGDVADHLELAARLVAYEQRCNRVRDGYGSAPAYRRAEEVEGVLDAAERFLELFARFEKVPRPLADDWEQVQYLLRRLATEQAVATGAIRTWERGRGDPMQVAAGEIEDLSDDLKRWFFRHGPAERDVEQRIVKEQGRPRHRVTGTRLERAVLEFEATADDLKRAYREDEGPGDVRDLVDALARTARTIEHAMDDVSTEDEARREWNELLPSLRFLLRAHGLQGIGVGWERSR